MKVDIYQQVEEVAQTLCIFWTIVTTGFFPNYSLLLIPAPLNINQTSFAYNNCLLCSTLPAVVQGSIK